MNRRKLNYYQQILILGLIFLMPSTLSVGANDRVVSSPDAPVENQDRSPEKQDRSHIHSGSGSLEPDEDNINFIPDLTDLGRPETDKQITLASRGQCKNLNQTEPKTQILLPKVTPGFGLTISSYPTFWFYIPYQRNDFHSLKFSLLSDRDEKIYSIRALKLTSKLPGVIKFKLPSDAPPLQPNKTYKWLISVYCDDHFGIPQAPDEHIQGTIKMLEPSSELNEKLQAATTPRQKAKTLARYGIWYDLLTELGTNGSRSQDWVNLLRDEDVRLDDLSSKPIVECCTETPTVSP